jgi:hypothetical protein
LKNQPGSVQEISPEYQGDQASARQLYDAAKRVDEDKDMIKLFNWAKTNPGKRLHGNLDFRARRIGSVSNPASVFAD